jgi:hypothetical protein
MLLLLCQRVVIRAVSGTTRWGGDDTTAMLFRVLLTAGTLDAEAILANTHHPAELGQLLCECLQGLILEAQPTSECAAARRLPRDCPARS